MTLDSAPQPQDDQSGLLNAWRVIRERWWIVALAAIVCAAAAIGRAATTTKQYSATSKLLLQQSNLASAIGNTNLFPSSIDPQRTATTDILLLTSADVGQAVRYALHTPESVSDLLSQVSVSSEQNTDVLDITVKDSSPTQAAAIANAFASQYVVVRQNANRQLVINAENYVRQRIAALAPTDTVDRTELDSDLQKLTSLESVQTGDAQVVQRAAPPSSPSSPAPKRDALLGLLLGLGLGTALAFLLDFIDRRVKTVEDFERLYGMPALVGIPEQSLRERRPALRSATFEPFRILRTAMTLTAVDRPVKVVVITSAVPGEGKTSVAVNLARAAVASGDRVVLVEADMRRPSLHRHVRIDRAAGGLTNAVVTKQPVESLLQYEEIGRQSLAILPSGPPPPGTTDIMRSQAVGHVLNELASRADLVIIDAPPLLAVADAQVLVARPEIDFVLIVGRAYFTKRDQVRRARGVLVQRKIDHTGMVVSGLRDSTIYEYYGLPDEKSSDEPLIERPSSNGGRGADIPDTERTQA